MSAFVKLLGDMEDESHRLATAEGIPDRPLVLRKLDYRGIPVQAFPHRSSAVSALDFFDFTPERNYDKNNWEVFSPITGDLAVYTAGEGAKTTHAETLAGMALRGDVFENASATFDASPYPVFFDWSVFRTLNRSRGVANPAPYLKTKLPGNVVEYSLQGYTNPNNLVVEVYNKSGTYKDRVFAGLISTRYEFENIDGKFFCKRVLIENTNAQYIYNLY